MHTDQATRQPIDPPAADRGPRRRRRWVLIAAGALLALGTVVVVWFEPQTLFFDDRVDEALPVGSGALVERARGSFTSLDHPTSGTALVLELTDGARVLRLADFETDNGPDLYVYLSAAPPGSPAQALDDDVVDLGRLKGNIGDQNYELPAGVDLGRYRTVVVWCERFSVAFGAASIA